MWLVPIEDLSADQTSAVRLDISRHRVLHGGPGSGKTLVLAHRAKSLMEERGVERDRIRLLVYTTVLGQYLRQGLADLGLSDICLGFDAWCRALLKQQGIPVPRNDRGIDHAQVRVLVRDALAGLAEPPLDVLLVDEGQDLDEVGLAILSLAARHVTVAMDSRQQLYENGVSSQEVAQALGVARRQPTLLSAYRCTPHIVAIASMFLDDPQERHRFRAANLMPLAGREQPILVNADDLDGELDLLVAELQQRAMLGQQSLVLLPNRRAVFRYIGGLRRRGMSVKDRKDVAFDGTPVVLTYHSAKGLTCDAVFLPGLTERNFFGTEADQVARLLFVGVTRATQWAWLGVPGDGALPMLNRLESLIASGDLRRMSGGSPIPSTTADAGSAPGGSTGRPGRRPGHPAADATSPAAPTPTPEGDALDDLMGLLG